MAHKSILGPRGRGRAEYASRALIDDATQRAFQQSRIGGSPQSRPSGQRECLASQGRPDQSRTEVDGFLNLFSQT